MIPFFNLILEDPLKGLLIFIISFSLYLWREQGKIKMEIKTMERFLDDKKLDKEDFKSYNENHEKIHEGFIEHLKTAIALLKGGQK